MQCDERCPAAVLAEQLPRVIQLRPLEPRGAGHRDIAEHALGGPSETHAEELAHRLPEVC